ncbi:hypothetical protein HA075_07415 [bacterium BFN5]|nr:hypothetical protein HA075_07415 [bacterium BFN5]
MDRVQKQEMGASLLLVLEMKAIQHWDKMLKLEMELTMTIIMPMTAAPKLAMVPITVRI